MGIQGRIFIDFGMILEPHFDSFCGTEGSKPGVVFGFVSMPLLTPISGSKSGHLGLLRRGFHLERNVKTNFLEKSEF